MLEVQQEDSKIPICVQAFHGEEAWEALSPGVRGEDRSGVGDMIFQEFIKGRWRKSEWPDNLSPEARLTVKVLPR